jgi:Protein of unknown function (DUF2637)
VTGRTLGYRPAAVLDGSAAAPGRVPELTITASHRRSEDRLWHEAGYAAWPRAAADPPVVPGPGPAWGRPGDRSGAWLRTAMAGLAVLAAAAAVVSFQAQYRMVAGYKHAPVIAAVQASIPDAAALVFASLGIALALHGRRALRARALNVAAVAASVAMNALAASPGWRAVAVWVLPPVAYALASDTLIGVVRAWVLARERQAGEQLAGEDATPLAVLGGLVLWLLRLVVAPVSTLAGFRAWVVEECPLAPGRRAPPAHRPVAVVSSGRPGTGPAGTRRGPRPGSKTRRFLALVAGRHGPLAQIPVGEVSRICTALAPQAGLDTGAARTALRRAVLAARDGRTP